MTKKTYNKGDEKVLVYYQDDVVVSATVYPDTRLIESIPNITKWERWNNGQFFKATKPKELVAYLESHGWIIENSS